ncbi:PA14 domain protein [Ruegeria denitrificans]|uniref:PA14 domain protein n=1 Tax=Ruegeria denitrificans TaxID=1715692 RepID=A0A0P1IJR7_9RHOB|nr:PA14 domain-containing protein [Ruegeria denitrificans]CUK17866.1 PA14 domain protein [Ruegeria denitrificans]
MGEFDKSGPSLGSGLPKEQREKEAFASELSKGAQISPEDQSRSALHTGEQKEGSAIVRESSDAGQVRPDAEPAALSVEKTQEASNRSADSSIEPSALAALEEGTAEFSQNATTVFRHNSDETIQLHPTITTPVEFSGIPAPSVRQSNFENTNNAERQVEETTQSNHAPEDVSLTSTSVAENSDGAIVGTLSAQDQDSGDGHSYSVSDDRFEVVEGELKLKDGVTLDHESNQQIEVQVTVTDAAGEEYTEGFSIEVTDRNDAVTGMDLSGTSVSENADGAVVGTLSVQDQDSGDSHSYSVSDDRFEVVDGELKLKDGVTLDYEPEQQIEVQVTVTDAAGTAHAEGFSIEVTDQNELPSGLRLSTESDNLVLNGSYENFEVGSGGWNVFRDDESGAWETDSGMEIWDNLGNTNASDGQQHLEMDAGHGVDSFSQTIQTSKGQVYDLGLDLRERLANGTDTVEVYWNDKLVGDLNPDSTDWTTFEMQVVGTGEDKLELREAADENDSYGALVDNITLTAAPNVIAENVSGAIVGQLSFEDPDGNDSHVIEISDDRFEVVDGILRLKETTALDFEDASTVEVSVTVTDAGGLSTSETFTVDVADTPDLIVSTGFQAQYFDMDQRLTSLDDIDWNAKPTHQELVSQVDYENGRDSFWEGGSKDTFGVEITGAVQVDEGGIYRFDLGGDDGAQLVINGEVVVANDGLHAYQTKSGEVHLDPGTHHIEVRYFENYGHAGLKLEWEGPGMDGPELVTAPDMSVAQTVSGMSLAMNVAHPEAELSEATSLVVKGLPPGTVVEAGGQFVQADGDGSADIAGFDSDLLTITPPHNFIGEIKATLGISEGGAEISQPITINVDEPQITVPTAGLNKGFRVDYIDMDHRIGKLDDVDWESAPDYQEHRAEIDYENSRDSFWEGGSKDTFATRVQGQVTVEEGGQYTFHTSADDGVVIYVNGQEVVKDDGNHGYRGASGQIELEPGTHDIEVRYFENFGRAGLKLEWEGPDVDGRRTVQADQEVAVDVNGTLDVGIALDGVGAGASVAIEGLPRNTILTSGDNAIVADGGTVDLSSWNIDALEISPPSGYEGAINGEIVLYDTAFNGAPVTSSSEFTIAVGDIDSVSASVGPEEDMVVSGSDSTEVSEHTDVGWDGLADYDGAGDSDVPSGSQTDVMAETVLIQNTDEISQIGTETYERLDW